MAEKVKKKDTFSYKGWLNSDHFLKRAFAVVGYYFVGGMLIYLALLVVILIFVLLFGGLGYMFKSVF